MRLGHSCCPAWCSVISAAAKLAQETLQLAPYVWWVDLQQIKYYSVERKVLHQLQSMGLTANALVTVTVRSSRPQAGLTMPRNCLIHHMECTQGPWLA
jgi:hypothetical protein